MCAIRHVTEAERRIPVAGESDVFVAGAGPAGIAAALAAARTGARVRLVDVNGCLGGMWTAGLLTWMFEMDQPGMAREISNELGRRGARIGRDPNSYTYDIEQMKLLLDELCLEARVRVRLHTRAVAAVVDADRRLSAVITESNSGREAWTAKCFIDATGNGDLAAQAGCGWDVGRPGSGECQPMTYMALIAVRSAAAVSRFISFWPGKVSWEQHRAAVQAFAAELARAGCEPSYASPTLFQMHGSLLTLMVNHEYGVSAMDAQAITEATMRGRAEVNRVVRGLRALGGVWEDVALVATCEQIGVREGRRIHGLSTVTQDDLAAGARHEDAVCRVSFGVDVHCTNPARGKGQEPPPIRMQPYDIRFRALVARDVSNLMLAGRCISGDFIAHSSYRVTGVAAATGQAAGVAAALSAEHGTAPADLTWPDVRSRLERLCRQRPGPGLD